MKEMKDPVISVIVPLLNKANEIKRALDSILAQTFQNFEIIVVDGGSTDGSLEIVYHYSNESRINIIHQISKGVSGGRNEGISQSHGDLIAFLDADDEWIPTFLEEILELRKNYPGAGIYATAFVQSTSTGRDKKPSLGDIPKDPWSGLLPSYFRSSALAFMYPFMTSSAVVPRSVLEKVGLFNVAYQWGEDAELWGRIALEYPVAFTSKVGMRYSMTAENKLSMRFSGVEKHPFALYLESSYPQEKLQTHHDYKNILLYLDKENLALSLNELYAGNNNMARTHLKKITCKYFKKYKHGLLALSYLPKCVLKKVLPIANSFGRRYVSNN